MQQDVRAVIRLWAIAQHRRLNLMEINGGGLLLRLGRVRSSGVDTAYPWKEVWSNVHPRCMPIAAQPTLSRNSSTALPIFSSRLVSTTVKFGLATYQK